MPTGHISVDAAVRVIAIDGQGHVLLVGQGEGEHQMVPGWSVPWSSDLPTGRQSLCHVERPGRR